MKYSTNEMAYILKKIRETSESIEITETKHFIQRIVDNEKYCDYETVYYILKNSEPHEIQHILKREKGVKENGKRNN